MKMKITIKPLLEKVKDFASEYTKAFTSMLSGFISIIVSSIFQFHSLWQLDLICVGPVWGTPTWIANNPAILTQPYSSLGPFIDGPLFRGTIGQAYDFFLGMNAVGWGLAIVGTFLIMLGIVLFYRANMLEANEILRDRNI